MPIKPIDRLLFAQGGHCFFCARQLTKADASIEHLVARAHDGKDNDENCVACCKQLNALFGRVSLKEKLRIILNQHGTFVCPTASIGAAAATVPGTSKAEPEIPAIVEAKLVIVMNDLRKRGAAKPRQKWLSSFKHFRTVALSRFLEARSHMRFHRERSNTSINRTNHRAFARNSPACEIIFQDLLKEVGFRVPRPPAES